MSAVTTTDDRLIAADEAAVALGPKAEHADRSEEADEADAAVDRRQPAALDQRLPALSARRPLVDDVDSIPTRPGRKRLARVVLIEFGQQDHCRLLNDLLRVGDVGDQCGHVSKQLPFRRKKQPQEQRLGVVT